MIRKSLAALAAVVLTVLVARWAETRPVVRDHGVQQPQSAAGSAAGPAFVQVNKKYVIRWQPGDNEVYTILELRGGWARARRDPGSAAHEGAPNVDVWVNLVQAITITERR